MAMACASATTSATITVVGSSSVESSTRSMKRNVHFIRGLNSFGGLKAQNSVTSLGLPLCTEQCFSKVVSSLKHYSSSKGRGGGGAASSTCNAAGEIFQIAAIMNGLVLVGVAVGFVLLRVEASVEEAE